MNKRERIKLQVIYESLSDVFDTLESTTDSNLDFFEDEEEERDGAPTQYAARKVFIAMIDLEDMLDGD